MSEPKNKGGRPRKELSDADWQKLIAMIRIQCTQDEICGIFGMTAETLNERIQERGEDSFSTLFKKHSDEGKASLRRAQWKAATEDHNPTMLVWMGKQMLGQRDKQEITGKDGEPLIRANELAESLIAHVTAARSTDKG